MHILSPVTNNSPGFLNQRKGENDCRNDFMINLHGNYLAKLGFELVTPGSVVRHAKDWARKPSSAHKKSLAEALNWVPTTKENQRTDSPKSLLACKVLMECCVSSMQFYTIHAKKIDDIPMLPILYDKMELYGIYQASGHCTSWIEDFL